MNKSDGNGENSFLAQKSVSAFTSESSSPSGEREPCSRKRPPASNDSLSPDRQRRVVGLSKRGHQLLKSKKFQSARDVFEQACRLDGQNPYILSGLAEC
ncbi:MAG TPA: hypothetical protein VJ995_10045, partial [Geothermobacteraceae bacterium]|nr:hypothetical protein [Geothermobacteraceae bacterium]